MNLFKRRIRPCPLHIRATGFWAPEQTARGVLAQFVGTQGTMVDDIRRCSVFRALTGSTQVLKSAYTALRGPPSTTNSVGRGPEPFWEK